MIRFIAYFFILIFLSACQKSEKQQLLSLDTWMTSLRDYTDQLNEFMDEFGDTYELPEQTFYLFGMGNRQKYLYRDGLLIRLKDGKPILEMGIKDQWVIPNEYAVFFISEEGERFLIREDEKNIRIITENIDSVLESGNERLNLPEFEGSKYSEVRKVLHQEILVNIVDSKPVPNFLVYPRPWRRDAAMMAMVLKETDNLSLIRDWVMGLEDPYDHNNGRKRGAPENEADNLGQTLYLLSLFTDRSHPLVDLVLSEAKKYAVNDSLGHYIRGRTDFQEVPVYQTKWLIYGLDQMGIDHDYTIPEIPDDYSSLFWWDYTEYHIPGSEWRNEKYPYIGWARDHFNQDKQGLISNRVYPLSWETEASEADYGGMFMISEKFSDRKIAAPHTWHAAEIFLYLNDLTLK